MDAHGSRRTPPAPTRAFWTSDVRAAYGGALDDLFEPATSDATDVPTIARPTVPSERPDGVLASRVHDTLAPLLERPAGPSALLAARELARGYGELSDVLSTAEVTADPSPPARTAPSTNRPRGRYAAGRVPARRPRRPPQSPRSP